MGTRPADISKAMLPWEEPLAKLEKVLEQRSDVWTIRRLDSGWIYAMRLSLDGGRWVVSEVRMFADTDLANLNPERYGVAEPDTKTLIPPGGLTARTLRRIPFGGPVAGMAAAMRVARKIAKAYTKDGVDKDTRLARVASAYVDALRAGSRMPTVDCAKHLGLSASRVRDAVHHARVGQLLTHSRGQGLAGGELTPRAVALLEKDQRDRRALESNAAAETQPAPVAKKRTRRDRKAK